MMGLAAGMALGLCTGQYVLGGIAAVLIELSARRALPWIGVVSVFAVGLAGLAFWWGWPLESVLATGLAWFVVHQRSTSGRPATDVLLVGLLLVVCATRTRSPVFGLAVLGWGIAIPSTLGSPAWLGLPVMAVAVPIFFFTPRFVPSDLRTLDARGLTGFSSDVELGSMVGLLDDASRVFEATFDRPLQSPPYFRGIALDRFDGKRWWSEAPRIREPSYSGGLADAVRMEVVLEAHPEAVLFVPGTVDGVDADGLAIERDAGGAYHLPGPPRRVRYSAWVRLPFGPGRRDPFLDATPRLDLPELSDAVRSLFNGAVPGAIPKEASPRVKMEALSEWLRSSYAYTREPRDLDVEAPLERFLLESREGHCEYFASALAVGGRVVGVPTRVVNGFVGGEPVGDRVVIVRRFHAHSWVEYFDGDQWITIDSTPPVQAPDGPDRWTWATEQVGCWWGGLVSYDGDRQVQVARDVAAVVVPDASPLTGAMVGAAVMGGSLTLVFLVGRRMVVRFVEPAALVKAHDPVTTLVLEARELLVERGWQPPQHLPDVELARWIRARDEALGEVLEALSWRSYGVRFGQDPVDVHLAEAVALMVRLRLLA